MKFKLSVLLLFIAGWGHCANAHTYTFDASMLGDAAKGVDMSLFNQGVQQPGTYRVDVLVNGERVDTRDVVFKLEKDRQGTPFLAPCLTVSQLSRYGVKTEDYPQLWKAEKIPDECADLTAIPQAKAVLDINNQQLQLSIPQLALRPEFKGIAPEDLWDDGIPAFLMNYSARTTQTDYKMDMEGRDSSSWVQLQPGINIGAWRVRNATSWQRSSQLSGKWQSAYIYAERGLYSLKSSLTLGQKTSQGEIFDSVPFTGVMLASDDNMVPYSERQFAPVVRGIARTQARVEVKQNGYMQQTLTQEEMIGRYISYVPARHFKMVRYYGFLSNRKRGALLPKVYEALEMEARKKPERPGFAVLMKGYLRTDPYKCVLCGNRLRFTGAQAGKHATELVAERLHGIARKRWLLAQVAG